jgi:hypothetical protein
LGIDPHDYEFVEQEKRFRFHQLNDDHKLLSSHGLIHGDIVVVQKKSNQFKLFAEMYYEPLLRSPYFRMAETFQ